MSATKEIFALNEPTTKIVQTTNKFQKYTDKVKQNAKTKLLEGDSVIVIFIKIV